jgi:hypothetical protein
METVDLMSCFFSRRLNGDGKGRVKSPTVFACLLPEYLSGKNQYVICSGDLDTCAAKHSYISEGLNVYWNSKERKHHELLLHQAKIENGF